MKKCTGFTLTEVLVALGIIGVVSAMTVPTLTQNWQRRAHTTELQKVYNEFQHAFDRLLTESHVSNLYEASIAVTSSGAETSAKDFLLNHFKITKECGLNTSSGCFASTYHTLSGSASNNPNFAGYNVLLASGSAIAFSTVNNSGANINGMTYGRIIVDVNGSDGPNVGGRDLFTMYVFPDGILDVEGNTINCRINSTGCTGGSIRAARDSAFNSNCKTSINSSGCFGKILNDNWVMNY